VGRRRARGGRQGIECRRRQALMRIPNRGQKGAEEMGGEGRGSDAARGKRQVVVSGESDAGRGRPGNLGIFSPSLTAGG
jgi:hypothetical protein